MRALLLARGALLTKHYTRLGFKTESQIQATCSLFTRNLSLNAPSRPIDRQSKFSAVKSPLRTNLLANQLNVASFAFSSRSLSSHGFQSEAIGESLSDPSQDVIDLTETPSQEQLHSANEWLMNQIETVDTSITALGLGSNYTPIGWCLHYLDFLHSVFPWWGTIAIGTIILRLSMFPLVIGTQRTSAKMNEILPEQAILKEKMNQARLVGDTVEFARLANESHTLFKRHNVSPIKAMLAPLAQVPVFLTLFLTLRRMANYPVESLKTGGVSWVTDLSIPDPLFILPIITSLTLWASLEMSFRSGMNPNQTPIFKYGVRVLPFMALFFTYNFPSAIMVYWFTNNFLSVIQVFALRQPAVRSFLNIPQIKVNPQKLDVNKKSFKTHFTETIENAKINKMMEERKTIDEINFRKAGIGPLKKTYKKDPTRVEN